MKMTSHKLLSILASLVLSSQAQFKMESTDQADEVNRVKGQSSKNSQLENTRIWIEQAKVSLPVQCSQPHFNTSSTIIETKALIRYSQCTDAGATDTFSFSGKFNSQGKLTGKGIVRIGENEPKQNHCVKVRELFGWKIVSIESEFDEGFTTQKAFVELANEEGEDMKAELLIHDGVPRGLYRAETRDWWALGTFLDGLVTTGQLWIIYPTYVHTGLSVGEANPHAFSPDYKQFILYHNMSVAITANQDPKRLGPGHILYDVHDLLAIKVQQMQFCSTVLSGYTTSRPFNFDLNKFERDYELSEDTVNQCLNVGTEPTEAIQTYLSNIKNVAQDPSPVNHEKAKKFLSFIEPIENRFGTTNMYEAVMTLQESNPIDFSYNGGYNKQGQFHGQAILDIISAETCYKGNCQTSLYNRIIGTFEDGVLHGFVILYSLKGDKTTYFMVKEGVVHSMVISMGLKPVYPTIDNPSFYKLSTHDKLTYDGVSYLARFVNGRPEGPVLIGLVGYPATAQGFLYGKLNKKGKLTGDNIAYVYPDYKTVLYGTFEDKYMKSALKTEITEVQCKDGLLQLDFSVPDPNSQEFKYDPPSNINMGAMWYVKDPLEEKLVELKESLIKGAGQGIFAKEDIPAFKVAALYNGLIFNVKQLELRDQKCALLEGESKKMCFKYSIKGYMGAIYDIPEEFDDVKVYNSTLGHKVNNQFSPVANSDFWPFEHPRFGLIISILTLRNIAKGEELFIDYGYDPTLASVTENHKWYFTQKEEHLVAKAGLESAAVK